MSARAALRVFSGALVGGALLIVLQTATYRVVSPSWPFRALFALDDIAVFVALVMLSRRAPAARGVLRFAGLFALLAILTHIPVPDASLSVVGLPFALGLTLLSLLALAAMRPAPGRHPLVPLTSIAVGLALCFRIAKMAAGGSPMPLSFAWTSWTIEVLRPLLLAAFAWSVSRELAPASVSPSAPSPYREAGSTGAPESLPESARPYAQNTEAALVKYSAALVARGAALFAPVVAVVLVVGTAMNGRSLAFVLVAIVSLASIVTEAMLLASTSRLRSAVANIAPQTRGLLGFGSGALVVSIVADGLSLLTGMFAGDGEASVVVFFAYVMGAALSLFSLLTVVRALEHVGKRLGDDRVVALARLFVAESVTSGGIGFAAILAFLSGGREAALLVTSLLFLGAGGIVIAGFVCARMLLNATRDALRSALLPPPG